MTEFKVIYENPSKPYRQAARCCYSERCISGDEAMYVVSSDVIRMRVCAACAEPADHG
jgi:hypothetical protein